MRERNNTRCWIAGLVLLSFAWVALGTAADMPLGATTGRTDGKAGAVQMDPATDGENGVLEKSAAMPTISKKKKFP
ncbi:MAG: hypothetical protein JXI33_06825 [Candidatus Aminicenantes bacterium]|nr:hypothetical protein [Candidatus Aminicenantes bacterium]